MKSFIDLSIRQKLMWVSMITSLTALAIATAAYVTYDTITFRHSLVTRLEAHADIIGQNSASAILFNDAQAARNTLRAFQARPHITAAAIFTANGAPFASYQAESTSGAPALLHIPGVNDPTYRFSSDHLTVFKRIVFDNNFIGTVAIQSDLAETNQRLQAYLGIAALLMIFSFLAATIVAAYLEKRISTPIMQLADIARHVSRERDYSVRASVMSRDELGQFTATFNEMLGQIQTQQVEIDAAHQQLEARVQERTSQLQEAYKELESFSYSVSHDLRAPLRAIDGFSRMILEDHGPKLDNEARRLLDVVIRNTGQMSALIDALLSFSRLSRKGLQMERLDMTHIAQNVIEELKALMPDRTIDFILTGLPSAKGDTLLIRQVFLNLISNAIKFTRHQVPPTIEIGSFPQDGQNVYFVKDNGAGFNMEYVDKLFGVFQRLHSSEEFEGTGIGLANVQRIIARHGGKVWAEGKVGQGATFYFTLDRGE